VEFDDVVEKIEGALPKLSELGAAILFDFGDDGTVLLNASEAPATVTPNPDDDEADTTLELSLENMAKLIDGDLNPMVAFTMGKLKVTGSKGYAMKLSALLDE